MTQMRHMTVSRVSFLQNRSPLVEDLLLRRVLRLLFHAEPAEDFALAGGQEVGDVGIGVA